MTEEERYEKLNDKLDRILEKIDGKLDGMDKKIQNHEVRIVVLETREPSKKDDWKTQLLMLLGKAITIGVVVIGSLVGAGSLLKPILGT